MGEEANLQWALGKMPSGVAYCRVLFEGPPPHDFVYLAVNDAFTTRTGLKDVVGKRVTEVIPGFRETDAELLNVYAQVASTGTPQTLVWRVEALDRWFTVSVYCPAKDHFVALFDTSHAMPAAEALRESELRFRTMADAAPVLIWTSGTDGLCDSFNAPWLAFTGRSLAQELGNGWADGVHPDDQPRCLDVYLTAFRARRAFSMEYRLRRADGAYRWLLDNGAPRTTPNGEFAGYVGSCVDVTPLKEAERRYRTLFEHLREDVSVYGVVRDAHGRVVDWTLRESNAQGRRTFGDDYPAAVGRRISELVGEAAMGRHIARSEAVLAGEVQVNEVEFAPNGRCYRSTLFALDADTLVAAAIDITEREAAEGALAKLNREQEVLLDTADAGIVMIVDRRQLWVNRWMEETFGYSRAEMVGRDTRMYYPSQEAFEALGRAAYPQLAQGLAFQTLVELRRKDGSPLWAKYHGRAVDPRDPARGVLWVLTDHTAQRQADEALRQSEARFRTLFESHSAVMLLVDPAGGAIVDANPAAAKFYGHTRAALQSMFIGALNVLPRVEVLRRVASAADTRQNTFLFQHRLASGELRTVEVSSSPVDVQGRKLLFSIIHDVTERTELEGRLARQRTELEQMNRSLEARIQADVAELRSKDQLLVIQSRQAAMGEMLGNIAHQWRQPLNALGLVLSNLQDTFRLGELDASTLEAAVATGSRLIQKMSSTISDFRDFFHPEKEKRVFSARAQLHETLALVDASFRHAGIAVGIEGDSEVSLFGFANEFSQVLLNLLANARQAIRARAVPNGRVTLRLDVQQGLGRVRVCDNGGGIAADVLDRIFEPYFSTTEGGTGIGLHMSRQIVERSLGGRIEARNVEGGAELSVFVPLAPARPSSG
jgi:PAS domain S-box-containing protein